MSASLGSSFGIESKMQAWVCNFNLLLEFQNMVSRFHLFNEMNIDISRSQSLLKEQLNLIVSPQFLGHTNMITPSTFQSNSQPSDSMVKKSVLSPAQKERRRRYKQKRSHRQKCPDRFHLSSDSPNGPSTVEPQTDIESTDSDGSVIIKVTSPVSKFLKHSSVVSATSSFPVRPPRSIIQFQPTTKSIILPSTSIIPSRRPPQCPKPRFIPNDQNLIIPTVFLPSITYSSEFSECLQMSAEDIILPSVRLASELTSEVYSFFRTKHWCVYCGLSNHLKCNQRFCNDCKEFHISVKCPKMSQWILSQHPAINNWYRTIRSEIRSDFDGNPVWYYFSSPKLGVISHTYCYEKN